MVYAGMFAALIAVGAFIKIPIPVIPATLQVFFVYLAGSILGSRMGAVSCVAYMLLGLIGVPVFTEGGGFWYLLKPSFGYIIGFCIAAYVIGKVIERADDYSVKTLLLANFSGMFVIYLVGLLYFYVISNYVIAAPIAVWPLILHCFLLVVPGDICFAFLAAFLARRLRMAMPELQEQNMANNKQRRDRDAGNMHQRKV